MEGGRKKIVNNKKDPPSADDICLKVPLRKLPSTMYPQIRNR